MGDTKDTEVVLILKYKFDKDQKTYQNFRRAVLASPPGQRAMKNHALSKNPGRTGLVTGARGHHTLVSNFVVSFQIFRLGEMSVA